MQASSNESRSKLAFNASAAPRIDFWMILDLLANRWWWFILGAIIGGAGTFELASKFIKPKFTASAQLLRYESPGFSEFLKQETPMSSDTFAGLIRAPDLLQQR